MPNKNWTNILLGQGNHNSFNGVNIINGHVSEHFFICGGCRQGDLISGYLFVLCFKVLVLLIKNSKIHAYPINEGSPILNNTYADDLTVYQKYRIYNQHSNTENFNILLQCLKMFKKMVWLKS